MGFDAVRARAVGGMSLLKHVENHPCISPPRLVSELTSSIRHVAAGSDYVLAVTKGGRLVAWGNGGAGTLGIGRKEVIHEPYYLKKFRTVKIRQVWASLNHACALTDGQILYSWGAEGQGQIGAKSVNEPLLAPVETFHLRGFKCSQVTVGPTITMCLCEKTDRVDHSCRILGTDETEVTDANEVDLALKKPDTDAPPDLAAYRAPQSSLGKWTVICAVICLLLATSIYQLVQLRGQ